MYQRILVPVDGSPTSKHGLQEAIRMARLTGGKLRLLHGQSSFWCVVRRMSGPA